MVKLVFTWYPCLDQWLQLCIIFQIILFNNVFISFVAFFWIKVERKRKFKKNHNNANRLSWKTNSKMYSYYLFCCLFDQIEKVVNNLVLGEVFAAFLAFQLLADLNTHRNKWASKLPNTRRKSKRSFNDILWDTFSNESNDLDNYKNIVINNDVITYPPCEAVGQFQFDCLHAALVHLDK